ncbi:MAG: TIM barrel protein, partial [Nanoarchaeota archaeon]
VSIALYANWLVKQNNPNAISPQALEELNNLTPKQAEQIRRIHAASIYADEAIKTAYGAFDKAVKNSRTEEDKKLLEGAAREYKEIMGANENGKMMNLSRALNPQVRNEALFHLIQGLEKVSPEIYVPIEKFAIEKSSESFGNAAWGAYKKLKGKNVPILTIENPPAGFALSTGEDIKNIVKASREQFVKNAVSNNISESEARKQAEKLIGATWDVGHINMLRKFGYSDEELVEETKKIAPLLKHVHLSDNFGFEHTELPMGMGNVPLKEMMKELGKKGFEARKIIEAAAWWQHWKTPPFQETLEAVGSPIYGMKMAPYWSQAPGLYQGYFSGFGQMLPQINYETFGAGFSRLPSELGGQIQGAQGGRMSGRPME